jgi:flagellum-specific peptidoglycan hydrolase FlgJ
MANNNLDNLNLNNLKSFNDILRLNTAGLSGYGSAQQKLIDEEKNKKKKLKKLIDSTEDFGQELIQIGKSLSAGSSTFGPLTKTITFLTKIASDTASQFGSVGKALGKVIDTVGKSANVAIEIFEKSYEGFEKLSQTGLVSSFEQMEDMSASTMTTISDLAGILEGQAPILSSWGGAAFKGAQEFKKLSGSLLTSRYDFQLLGITSKELQSSQLQYMAYETKITGQQQKFDYTHRGKFEKFMKNISDLSGMTGERREEIQKELDSKQLEADYAIFTLNRNKEQTEADNNLLETINFAFGPTARKAVRDHMIATRLGITAVSEEAQLFRQYMGQLGLDIDTVIRKHITSPTGDTDNVLDQLKNVSIKSVQLIGERDVLVGNKMGQQLALEIHKATQLRGTNNKILFELSQIERKKPPTIQDDALANARIRMNDDMVLIQNSIMSFSVVTKSMKYLAKTMNGLIKSVFKKIGKNVPDLLTVIMEQSDVQEKLFDSITELANFNRERIKIESQINEKKQQGTYTGGKNSLNSDLESLKKKIKDKELENTNLIKRQTEISAKREELEILKGYKEAINRSSNLKSPESLNGNQRSTPISGSNKEFFEKMYTAVYSEAKKAGVANPQAIAMLGATQSALETGYGKSLGGGNNYFGIKDFSGKSNNSQSTKEFINGKEVTVNQPFMTYNSMNESAADYVKLLTTSSRYKDVIAAKTVEEAISAQSKSGYATDPDYAKKLSSIYSSVIAKENKNNKDEVGFSYPDMSKGPPELTSITSKEGKTAMVNKKVAPQFQKLLDWFGSVGYSIYSLGGYNNRNIAGSDKPSWHSNGEAIDINPATNPYGKERITDMPEGTASAAARFGLGWGADWSDIKDAMHFSTGPNEGAPKARTGGIFDGPSTGYLIELHGREKFMILPDNDGNSSMFYGKKQKQSDKLLANLISMIDANVDEMIDLMNQKISLQERMKSA